MGIPNFKLVSKESSSDSVDFMTSMALVMASANQPVHKEMQGMAMTMQTLMREMQTSLLESIQANQELRIQNLNWETRYKELLAANQAETEAQNKLIGNLTKQLEDTTAKVHELATQLETLSKNFQQHQHPIVVDPATGKHLHWSFMYNRSVCLKTHGPNQ